MKRVLSIIFCLFCISPISNADNTEQQSKKPIMIVNGKPLVGIERTMQHVEAVLDLEMNTIEVEIYGLGEGDIYILDDHNRLVDYVPVCGTVSYFTFMCPPVSGDYMLVISCSDYYGVGCFNVE